MLDFLKAFKYLPSREGRQMFASTSEMKRWCLNGSVEVDGKKVAWDSAWPAEGASVILHPKSAKNRTTLQ